MIAPHRIASALRMPSLCRELWLRNSPDVLIPPSLVFPSLRSSPTRKRWKLISLPDLPPLNSRISHRRPFRLLPWIPVGSVRMARRAFARRWPLRRNSAREGTRLRITDWPLSRICPNSHHPLLTATSAPTLRCHPSARLQIPAPTGRAHARSVLQIRGGPFSARLWPPPAPLALPRRDAAEVKARMAGAASRVTPMFREAGLVPITIHRRDLRPHHP